MCRRQARLLKILTLAVYGRREFPKQFRNTKTNFSQASAAEGDQEEGAQKEGLFKSKQ